VDELRCQLAIRGTLCSVDWWRIARAQAGAISHTQLILGGLSPSSVCRMVATGELTKLSRGIYLAAGAPLSLRARLWSAVLATDGTLSHTTAGRLWSIHDDEDPALHVTIPVHRRLSRLPGVVLHRYTLAAGTVRHRSELPVTSRVVTVLDLLATLPASEATRLADRAVQRRWIVPADVSRRLERELRRPGNAQLRRVAAQLGDGAAADSERVLHRLLRRAGINGWRPARPGQAERPRSARLDRPAVHLGRSDRASGLRHRDHQSGCRLTRGELLPPVTTKLQASR
jgi:hypothetical protein